jgi:hypothetical protein
MIDLIGGSLRWFDSDVIVLSKIIDIHYYSINEPVPHFTAITATTACPKNVGPLRIFRSVSHKRER